MVRGPLRGVAIPEAVMRSGGSVALTWSPTYGVG